MTKCLNPLLLLHGYACFTDSIYSNRLTKLLLTLSQAKLHRFTKAGWVWHATIYKPFRLVNTHMTKWANSYMLQACPLLASWLDCGSWTKISPRSVTAQQDMGWAPPCKHLCSLHAVLSALSWNLKYVVKRQYEWPMFQLLVLNAISAGNELEISRECLSS